MKNLITIESSKNDEKLSSTSDNEIDAGPRRLNEFVALGKTGYIS